MALHLDKISAAKLIALPRDRTVFFFCTSPMDDFGPHLPLGLGLFYSVKQAELCAEKLESEMPGWTAILMPPAPLGIDSNATRNALTVRGHVLRDWLVDSCVTLGKQGFKYFVCFSGNSGPRQLTAIEEAGKMVRRKIRGAALVSANSVLVQMEDMKRSPLWPDLNENGGKRDTSIALALSPLLVDPNYRALAERTLDESRWRRALDRWRKKTSGYWGKPAEANAEWGRTVLKSEVDDVFPKLRAVLEGANPEGLFRSWYSVIPMNKSFFKAWILFALIFIVMIAWLYISIQTMTSI